MIWPRNLLDVEHFLKLFLPTAISYFDSNICRIPSSVWLVITLSISPSLVWDPGCAKNVLVEFSEKNYRENTGFWGRFFFHFRSSSLNALVVIFWNHAALIRQLPNSGWLLLTFEIIKVVFQPIFVEVGIVTSNLRCYLYWLFSA